MAAPASKSQPADWEAHRQMITDLYRGGHTQAEIQKRLETKAGFEVSIKQLEYRLKVWGLRKNITKPEYQHIQNQLLKRASEGGKNAAVYLNGVLVEPKKLKRSLRRYGSMEPSASEGGQPAEIEEQVSSTKDIIIMTPSRSPEPSTRNLLTSPNATNGSPNVSSTSIDLINSEERGKRRPMATTMPGRKRRRGTSRSSSPELQELGLGKGRRGRTVSEIMQKYACPFAKYKPETNVVCWNINRQNLAGVKEHLKRFHFGGILPPAVRHAKTWDETFDSIAPEWGSQARPTPYVDLTEIYQRYVGPSTSKRDDAFVNVQSLQEGEPITSVVTIDMPITDTPPSRSTSLEQPMVSWSTPSAEGRHSVTSSHSNPHRYVPGTLPRTTSGNPSTTMLSGSDTESLQAHWQPYSDYGADPEFQDRVDESSLRDFFSNSLRRSQPLSHPPSLGQVALGTEGTTMDPIREEMARLKADVIALKTQNSVLKQRVATLNEKLEEMTEERDVWKRQYLQYAKSNRR
ncbi:hypothetical protein TWF694_011736 [Orbilia ellipsospora]|uniref:Clr5 domain-containing protein n=1 Tax=Orbilia ellipsospora TaxID=2528407 RepID=A0AAV9X8Q8_9PEZI